MTDRNFGSTYNHWYGVVVNVNDPDKDGRVQVRIHGRHDDTIQIPDNMLPWAKPQQPIYSSGHNKIGITPVGVVKGSTVEGYYLDYHMQIPVYTGTISKAGDAQPGSPQGGQTTLVDGTNSTPISDRNKNNAFVTRQGKNIKEEDNSQNGPVESNDTEGKDVTGNAIGSTKYANIPTIGSLQGAVGSVLSMIQTVDPALKTSVLPNAVQSITSILDVNSFATSSASTNVLGMALSTVLGNVGHLNFFNALANSTQPGQLSPATQQTLSVSLQTIEGYVASALVTGVINTFIVVLEQEIQAYIKTPSPALLNTIIATYLAAIQDSGTTQTVGATQQNILQEMFSLIPQIAPAVQSVLSGHLPQSVLSSGVVSQALQNFAMSQCKLNSVNNGQKALAQQAVVQDVKAVAANLGSIAGISPNVVNSVLNML